MSVRNILTDLILLGEVDDTEQDKALAIYRLNQCADEIYKAVDIHNCQFEQVVKLDSSYGMQVSLPSYVGKLRSARFFYPNQRVELLDMSPRYQSETWNSQDILNFRVKNDMATQREISNASLITVTFKAPVEKALIVYVTGKTTLAATLTEQLCFEVGSQSKITFNSFETITSISKSNYCVYDCDVIDIDGVVLATLENNQLNTCYIWMQLGNLPNSLSSEPLVGTWSDYVEILFKKRFMPLVNESDEFICGPAYDKAIFYKYRAVSKSSVDGQEAIALGFESKVVELVKAIEVDQDKNLKKTIRMGRNGTLDIYDSMRNGNNTFAPYPDSYGNTRFDR